MNEYNDRVRSETYLNCGLLRFLMIIPALIVGVFSTISFSPQFISTNNVLILSSLYSRVSIALNSTNGFFFSQIVYWMERNQSYRTHYSFSKYMIHNYTSVVMYIHGIPNHLPTRNALTSRNITAVDTYGHGK